MNLERRTIALLELVEQYRASRCDELLRPAHAEARATIGTALAEARRRVHTAIVEERKRYGADVGAVEAALATERRLANQRHAVELLGSAWHDLRARLVARWDNAATRTQWIDTHMGRAQRSVPGGREGWCIETHPAWNGAEQARWSDRLRIDGVPQVHFQPSPSISAGFRVISGHNVLDATLDGLLADRAELEGRLLHHLQREPH